MGALHVYAPYYILNIFFVFVGPIRSSISLPNVVYALPPFYKHAMSNSIADNLRTMRPTNVVLLALTLDRVMVILILYPISFYLLKS